MKLRNLPRIKQALLSCALAFFLFGCYAIQKALPSQFTSGGIVTATNPPEKISNTNVPLVPSITPSSESVTSANTSNPQAQQAQAFAGPILTAIQSKPPSFADDFSNSKMGWKFYESYVAISNGVLKANVPEGSTGAWPQNSKLWASDFVFQIDARANNLERDSGITVNFRYLAFQDIGYTLSFFPERGVWTVYTHGANKQSWNGNVSDLISMGKWFTVLIVARGNQFAIYVNNSAVSYVVDDTNSDGQIFLGAGGPGGGSASVEFDNVKFWDLKNVTGLP